jgi:hypothetical protein
MHGCFPGSGFNPEPIMAGRRFVDAEEIEAGADIKSNSNQREEGKAPAEPMASDQTTNGQVAQVAPKPALESAQVGKPEVHMQREVKLAGLNERPIKWPITRR